MSCSSCGHDRNQHDDGKGRCLYEVWDDGQWLEGTCDCTGYMEEQPQPFGGGIEGVFSVSVWPVYIGCSLEGSTPPFTVAEPHNGGYERGTIIWTPVPDERQVIGRARILLPGPATYTHFLYFHHPASQALCGVAKMDFPFKCTEPLTVLDVDPILNNDLVLREIRG